MCIKPGATLWHPSVTMDNIMEGLSLEKGAMERFNDEVCVPMSICCHAVCTRFARDKTIHAVAKEAYDEAIGRARALGVAMRPEVPLIPIQIFLDGFVMHLNWEDFNHPALGRRAVEKANTMVCHFHNISAGMGPGGWVAAMYDFYGAYNIFRAARVFPLAPMA